MNPVLWREGDSTFHSSSFCRKVAGYSDGDSANPERLVDVYVNTADTLRKRGLKPCKRDVCASVSHFDIGELAFMKGFE